MCLLFDAHGESPHDKKLRQNSSLLQWSIETDECRGRPPKVAQGFFMSRLIMRRGPDRGRVYPLDAETITIGRGNRNTIIIRDNEVSREHVTLTRTERGYELYDLDSRNGTFINGIKVDDVWLLESQCIIELGDSVTLEYRPDDFDSNAHVQATPVAKPATGTLTPTLSYLVVLRTGSQREPAVYPLDSTKLVGRSTECDIVVIEPEMSRVHFRITLQGETYYIEDAGSTNGTLLNQESLIGIRPLQQNDMIQVGDMILFQFTNSPERFSGEMPTDVLGGMGNSGRTRKTSQTNIPAALRDLPDPVADNIQVSSARAFQDEVFVAYAREDWEHVVGPLTDKLFLENVSVWIDQYLPEGSEEWERSIEQARLECWLLVVVVSPAALQNEWVVNTWRHFHNREKPIILLIYKPVDALPFASRYLSRIQYNPALPDVAFQKMVEEIQRYRGT